MKHTVKLLLTLISLATANEVIAQEGQLKQRKDTLNAVDSNTIRSGQMPVVTPDISPVAPMPIKKAKENEDGMPVKVLPDSSMNRPKR